MSDGSDEIGQITAVDPRAVWPHEARDFSPWLASNLDRLSETLGLDLELESQEAGVGPFSLDLLARDLGRDRLVVIENQFGQTDHDHLGKLLTYAAGFAGTVVVWISEDFREEHRQALDWLNQATDDGTHFFGISIEVFRIDSSKPAVRLRLVAKPNQWQKLQRARASGAVSPRGEKYRVYFQALIDELRERHRFTNAKIAQPQSWYGFASGVSDILLGATFSQGDRVRTELYIGTGDADFNAQLFDWLREEVSEIHAEVGAELEWERLEDKLASRIALYREGSIDVDDTTLAEIRTWHIDTLLSFNRAFRDRLQTFKKKVR